MFPMMDDSFVKQIQNGVDRHTETTDSYGIKHVIVHNSDGTAQILGPFKDPKTATPVTLSLSSLSALVAYVKSGVAKMDVFVNVESPTRVAVIAPVVGEMRQAFCFALAAPQLPSNRSIGQFVNMEEFIQSLQTGFVLSDELMALQKLCSGVRATQAAELEDDGVSMQVQVSTSITRTSKVAVKPQWQLSPFRTFHEIVPPISPFILRMKRVETGRKDDPAIAQAMLAEADGGKWRVDTQVAIGDWLREQLGPDIPVFS